MTKISSSDLNMIESTLRQVTSAVGGEAGQYLNCVWTVGSIATGDHDQKVSGIQSLMNTLMSLLKSFGNNESSAATNQVNSNTSNIDNTSNKSKKLKSTIRSEINDTSKSLEEQNKIIEDATKQIEAEKKKVEEEQAKIQENINKITEYQTQLSSAKTSEEKRNLLNQIAGLSGEITTSISLINEANKIIEEAEAKVTEATAAIQEIQAHSIEVQENTETQVTELVIETQEEVVAEGTTQAEGVVNATTSTTAGTLATAAEATPFTAEVAPQLYKISADQAKAAVTRGTGAAKNMARIPDILADIGGNKSLTRKYTTTIGSQLSNYNNLIGNWNSTLEPLITSIGSFEGVDTTELDTAVVTDLATIGAEGSSDTGLDAIIKPENDSQATKGTFEWFTNLDNENSDSGSPYMGSQEGIRQDNSELLTPKVKIKAPQFGV